MSHKHIACVNVSGPLNSCELQIQGQDAKQQPVCERLKKSAVLAIRRKGHVNH